MSKYLTIFNTESQWQAAQDTLDYPNVSLIDTTGDLHYTTYPGKEVADAPFGSILMAEVSTNKLFYIEDSADYNLTDYPAEQFEPIGVCIYDKESHGHYPVFMSVKFVGVSNLSGSYSKLYTGSTYATISDTIPEITQDVYIDTRYANSLMINVGTSQPNWKTENTISVESDTIYQSRVAWRFKTTGTQEGEWFVPSWYDTQKMVNNVSELLNVFTSIKQYNNSIIDSAEALCMITSKEDSSHRKLTYTNNGSDKIKIYWNYGYGLYSKVVFIPGVNEL